MIVVVAVIALVCAAGVESLRSSLSRRFNLRAADAESKRADYVRGANGAANIVARCDARLAKDLTHDERILNTVYRRAAIEARDRGLRFANHFAGLKAKYERAARYPWLPVEPDPPPPE
jgi:hypothetical protein